MTSNIDILAIGSHPDDVELGCGGTIAKEISMNKSVGIIDLTQGELGTRGNKEIRLKESTEASKFLMFLLEKTCILGMVFSRMMRNIKLS